LIVDETVFVDNAVHPLNLGKPAIDGTSGQWIASHGTAERLRVEEATSRMSDGSTIPKRLRPGQDHAAKPAPETKRGDRDDFAYSPSL
jgi:hypothetical protein